MRWTRSVVAVALGVSMALGVELQDVGFSAQSQLAAGRYDFSGAHLSLDAPLAQDDQVVGTAYLEIDCG